MIDNSKIFKTIKKMERNIQIEQINEKKTLNKLTNYKLKTVISPFINFPKFFYIYFIFIFIGVNCLPGDHFERMQYKKPYISVIFIRSGLNAIVSPYSIIFPDKVFMTSTSQELIVDPASYSINIIPNNDLDEYNVTMEFFIDDYDMKFLFANLDNIKKVDLSNYNIKPTDTSFLFSECTNLEEIIFGDFDTSNVKDMYAMFQKSNIKRLDLSKFVTNNVTNMDYMFDSCQNLEYLDIRNFDFSKTIGCPNIFNGCEDSLKYLNIYSYKDENIFEYSPFFNNANNDLIYCINIETAPNLSSKLTDKGYIIDCSYFPNQESSVSSTYKISNSEIDTTNYIPKIKTELNELSYNVDTIKIIDECTSEEIFLKKCKSIINQTLSIENKDNLITNIINDIINGNLNIILNNIINGDEDDYIIKEDDIIFQLTTTENQNINEYNNISSIKLGNCEEILRNTYNISYNISLIILKVDYFIKEYNIPIIGYEIFHPITKEKLNISICYNTTIIYNIPVDINEKELDKYNISSDYYNDECSIYTTEDGTDIIISDRKQEYNDNNMFLCENNCQYTNYNISSKKSICNCEIKLKIYSISEIISNKDSISQNFNINNTLSNNNLNIMKCIDTLFSKYGILKNLEFYIIIIMCILYTGSGVLFYRVGYPMLDENIKEILDNKYENESKRKKTKKMKSTKKKNTNKSKKKKVNINISNPKKRNKNTNKKITITNTSHVKNKLNLENNSKSVTKLKIMTSNNNNQDNSAYSDNKNINNTNNNNNIDINDYTIYELNNLSYNDTLSFDKRDIMQYYISLIKTKHPLFFSFVPLKDHNSLIIKTNIFILKFCICSAINALFFTESIIHKIYKDKGKYNLSHFIINIIVSFFITHIMIVLIKYLILSEKNIIKIKKILKYDEAYDEADNIKRCLIIKYILFYIIGLTFIIIFWFYLSSFCAVYQNTQIFLIINTLISIAISFLYPFIINIIPTFIRKISLSNSKHECLYNINKYVQII